MPDNGEATSFCNKSKGDAADLAPLLTVAMCFLQISGENLSTACVDVGNRLFSRNYFGSVEGIGAPGERCSASPSLLLSRTPLINGNR